MAIDRPRLKNWDQESWDEQGAASPGRSYECSFCRRGFSNAQALGGHMNIHRRDKAKLKQDSPIEIIDIPSCSPDKYRQICTEKSIDAGRCSQETRNSHGKRPWDDDDVKERDSLFYEELSIKDQIKSRWSSSRDSGKRISSSQGSSGNSSELDLELRLGLEVPYDSSPTLTTRKFF